MGLEGGWGGPRPPNDHLTSLEKGELSGPGAVGLNEKSRSFHQAEFQLHEPVGLGWSPLVSCRHLLCAGFSQSGPKPDVVEPCRNIWEKHQHEFTETREKNTMSIYSNMLL